MSTINATQAGMCGKFNKQLGGIVTMSRLVDKGIIRGQHVFSIDVYLNGRRIDGAWGEMAEITAWLSGKSYI